MLINTISVSTKIICYHCGEDCEDERIHLGEKSFCCQGCKMVYEILNSNDLCQYYMLEDKAGISLKGKTLQEYAYLEDSDIAEKLLDYQDENKSKITLFLPQIHCASCIWLLENLYRLQDGILQSKVNFLRKEIYLTFSTSQCNVRQIVELLASIGYAPEINLQSLEKDKTASVDRQIYYQLGVAGFAFGNIMLMSFPEYLGLEASDLWFQQIFGYLNIVLALPVLFYSGSSYLQSAWLSLKQKHLNIDVPIALGMLTLFGRSIFEIISQTGAGYLDSMAGLVFFLLIGKWFQQKTYHQLSFERDYKSYFPLAATRIRGGQEQSIAVQQLEIGDFIWVKHGELIPADGILVDGKAMIDYSFVTGEAVPVERKIGDKIFAGGRQKGEAIKINLTKKVAQSYLTQLWNDDAFKKPTAADASELANKVGQYFTMAILTIAFATLIYWLPKDIPLAINAFTAVLIIACPCAVALSIPFTFGNVLRLFARQGFYLKNTNVIESLSKIDSVVLDKTGTLTTNSNNQIQYQGESLTDVEKQMLKTLTSQSSHPLSRMITIYLSEELINCPVGDVVLKDFKEITGQGLLGHFTTNKNEGLESDFDEQIKLGSADFIFKNEIKNKQKNINVYLEINGEIKGGFIIHHHYRKGLANTLASFQEKGAVHLLSGDNEKELEILSPLFEKNHLHFNQSPSDKLSFIKQLQPTHKVLMLGDGLNDAGALRQSDVGIVIAENTNNFTPACDAILDASQFTKLPLFIDFTKQSIRLVYASYLLAFIYNVIGLSYAVQGLLSPVVAAILMPLSSVTIVIFGVLGSHVLWRRQLHQVRLSRPSQMTSL